MTQVHLMMQSSAVRFLAILHFAGMQNPSSRAGNANLLLNTAEMHRNPTMMPSCCSGVDWVLPSSVKQASFGYLPEWLSVETAARLARTAAGLARTAAGFAV